MHKCQNCNTSINGKNKFCSKSCSSSYNNRMNPRVKKTKKCKLCDTLIRSDRKYCDICWNINKSTIQAVNTKPKNKCLNCQKLTKESSRNYCSKQCSIEHIFLQRVENVELSGVIYSDTKFNTSASFAKRYLRYKYGDKCSICNQSNLWNNKALVLILDHIDGTPNNWNISNLRLICPNCDSQTSTFKSKNNGKGRPRKT